MNLPSQIRAVVEPLLAGRKRCVLLDFPHHANVGDSAIWLGACAVLKSLGCSVRAIADIQSDSIATLERTVGEDIILLNGGGNFGDLWPKHHVFRELVINTFRNRRIIQLPQSIHFSSAQEQERSSAIISAHDDFHLVVRDQESYWLAQNFAPRRTYLAPDCAFSLDISSVCFRKDKETADIVVLARTDHERAQDGLDTGVVAELEVGVRLGDWIAEGSFLSKRLYERLQAVDKGKRLWMRPFLDKSVALAANGVAQTRLQRGLGFLSSGKVVVTDRLHAVILSSLLDIPVFFSDNSYGKIGNFVNCWLKANKNVIQCQSLTEALLQASDFFRNASR